MDLNVDIEQLRRKHKTELVERALSVFQLATAGDEVKSYWIECLLKGHDVRDFLERLKAGDWLPSDQAVPSDLNATSAFGGLHVIDENLELYAGLKRKLKVRLENTLGYTLKTTYEEPLFIAYHWYSVDGEVYEFDGARTPLREPVETGGHVELPINLTPPDEPGDYELMVTMVHEGRCWMEDAGLDVHRINCTVQDYDGRGLSRHALAVFKQLQTAEQGVVH
ncbi:hypothetical protein [Saccharospirillum sp.]|uniref:hypothetical protein n=1 Tax=Saccharospirillum sp. TaxID=2033801 RepID=UPI0034A084E9